MEVLLSIDNAAVLATMVSGLPTDQKGKALRYGIWGAFLMRGACLLFASILMRILWLKIAGGVYLLYLTYKYFYIKEAEGDTETDNSLYKRLTERFSVFWATIVLIEIMDMAFSIDNIFAAVAISNQILAVLLGVFIGIIAMRFVAQQFVKLLERYPFLESLTYVVIAILGIKLIISGVCDYIPENPISEILNQHTTDIAFSLFILSLFAIPIIYKTYAKTTI